MKHELDVLTRFYDFILWMIPEIGRIPRNFRFTLGERMETKLYEILDGLIEAKYTKRKAGILQKINLSLEQMRFQMRLCMDLKIWTMGKYEKGVRDADAVGKQVGGWLKASRSNA